MATRKTVDQILDKAADILEKHGWVTEKCYDSETGGFCALGAIARAAYPKARLDEIDDLAYEGDALYAKDSRHAEAVSFFAKKLSTRRQAFDATSAIYEFNDGLPIATDEQRFKSSERVVKKLRKAAEAYRKQQAKKVAA